MINGISPFFRHYGWQCAQSVVYGDSSHHGSEVHGGEIMMEVQDAAHCPEGKIMKKPSDEEPKTRICHSLPAL